MTQCFKETFGYDLHMLVDSRQFTWPMCPKGHCGLHDKFIMDVVSAQSFGNWLYRLKAKFEEAHKAWDAQDTFCIGFFCNAGINRSVACATISESILDMQGYIIRSVTHQSEEIWLKKGVCDGKCSTCIGGNESSAKTIKALCYACKKWNITEV